MLRVVAQRERTTVAELIRTFIVWGLEQYDGELDYDRDLRRGVGENGRGPFARTASRIFSARALMKIPEACFGHAVGYLSIY
jgi:hypothetical protein